jgi:hypothetical protein
LLHAVAAGGSVDMLNVLLKSVAAPSLADADSLDDLLGPDVATTATASASSASTVVEESRWSGHFDTDALRPSYSIMVCFCGFASCVYVVEFVFQTKLYFYYLLTLSLGDR